MQIDKKLLEIQDDFKILIVEDSKVSREYLKKILETHYHYKEIITAENGTEGIQKFKEHKPQIIITDIRMPEMDGLSMIEELKKTDKNFYTIVLSAFDEKEFLKEAISKGIYKFISKPVNIEELLKTIQEIKKIYQYQEKIIRQHSLIENILNSLKIIMVITNGEELFALNQYGLNFTGYSSLDEFKKEHKCICDFFLNEEGFIKNTEDWLKIAKQLESYKRKVIIQNHHTKEKHIFYLDIQNFELDSHYYIVVFYDITIQEKQREELQKLATIDFLTGIYNRQHFHTLLEFHLEKHLRYKELVPFGLLLLDLDHFKQINDTYGHLIGDQVLKEFCKIIKQNIRKSDFFARWGGEEFIILSTESTKEQLIFFAEKIRHLVEDHFSNHKELPKLTVSIGVTQFHPVDNLNILLERVDKALYLAKQKGRNRVEYL